MKLTEDQIKELQENSPEEWDQPQFDYDFQHDNELEAQTDNNDHGTGGSWH